MLHLVGSSVLLYLFWWCTVKRKSSLQEFHLNFVHTFGISSKISYINSQAKIFYDSFPPVKVSCTVVALIQHFDKNELVGTFAYQWRPPVPSIHCDVSNANDLLTHVGTYTNMHAQRTTNTQLTMFRREILIKEKHRIGTTFNGRQLHS